MSSIILFLIKFSSKQTEVEELRSRLDEKDSTLEKSRRQLSQLKAEKAGLDEEKTELGEALDIKEKKISLLQVRTC